MRPKELVMKIVTLVCSLAVVACATSGNTDMDKRLAALTPEQREELNRKLAELESSKKDTLQQQLAPLEAGYQDLDDKLSVARSEDVDSTQSAPAAASQTKRVYTRTRVVPASEAMDSDSPPIDPLAPGLRSKWGFLHSPPSWCKKGSLTFGVTNSTELFMELFVQGGEVSVSGNGGGVPYVPPGETVFVCLKVPGSYDVSGFVYELPVGSPPIRMGKFKHQKQIWPTIMAEYSSIEIVKSNIN